MTTEYLINTELSMVVEWLKLSLNTKIYIYIWLFTSPVNVDNPYYTIFVVLNISPLPFEVANKLIVLVLHWTPGLQGLWPLVDMNPWWPHCSLYCITYCKHNIHCYMTELNDCSLLNIPQKYQAMMDSYNSTDKKQVSACIIYFSITQLIHFNIVELLRYYTT